jgi:hypothetical protein
VGSKDMPFVHARLKEVIKQLNQMKRFSSQRGEAYRLRAQWLN